MVRAYLKILSQDSSGEAEGDHKDLTEASLWSELGASQIQP
jgi:hypothetical protein